MPINTIGNRTTLEFLASWQENEVVEYIDELWKVIDINDKWVCKLRLLNHPEWPEDIIKVETIEERIIVERRKMYKEMMYLIDHRWD